jgi:iron complex outermembrane receptor protein
MNFSEENTASHERRADRSDKAAATRGKRTMLRRLSAVLFAQTAAVSLLAGLAAAQAPEEGTAPPEAASGASGEAIVVTAQRRRENVQNVPIPVTAIGGDKLDAQGIVGFDDLTARVPSMRFGSGVTGGENVITMRGLGSQNTTSGGDSPVAYSVDGVYMARSTAVDPEYFDVNRIEILRGPQGTLYGRNSVGGSVNVVTNRPDDEMAGYADVMVGNYSAITARGWFNAPLTSPESEFKVSARITGVYSEHDGYQKNLSDLPTATNNSDGQDFWMVRGQLLFEFNPNVELLLSASYNSNEAPVATKLAWGIAPLGSQGRFVGQTYDPNPRHTEAGYPDTFDQDGQVYSATLEWNLGWAVLTSITAYTEGSWFQTNDADSTELDIAHLNYWTMDSEQFSQEIRLASNDDESPLRWIFGAFYFNEQVNQGFEYVDTGLNAPFGTGFVFTNGGDIETTSWAGFAQLDYDLGKTSLDVPLTITVGLRYTKDKKHVVDFLNYHIPDYAFTLFQDKDVDPSWNEWTGKVGLAYQATENVLLFANVSRGYLAGGELVGNFPGIYDPETVMNYEFGVKSTLADGRVILNATAYRTAIKDMQVFVQDITGSRIDNAGEATVTGLELEGVFYVTDAFRLNVAGALTDAEYDEYFTFDNRQPQVPPVLSDFGGNRLIQTPEFTLSLGAQYEFETDIGTITPRADIFWSGDLYFLSANTERDRQPAYNLIDLSLSWSDPDERYSAMAFVRNVGDEDIISNDGLQSNTIGLGFGMDNYTFYPPRTFGLRIGAHF